MYLCEPCSRRSSYGTSKTIEGAAAGKFMGVYPPLESNLCFQLPNPPEYPLHVVSVRSIHRVLKEIHELEDLGLNDDPRENGVVQVVSEALNVKWDYDDRLALRRTGGIEPWLDIQLLVHGFLVWSVWRIEIVVTGPEKMLRIYVAISI
jgi:hypothetical protein